MDHQWLSVRPNTGANHASTDSAAFRRETHDIILPVQCFWKYGTRMALTATSPLGLWPLPGRFQSRADLSHNHRTDIQAHFRTPTAQRDWFHYQPDQRWSRLFSLARRQSCSKVQSGNTPSFVLSTPDAEQLCR